MTPRRRVAILISGRGSNMAALIAAAREPDYPAEITVVISNRTEAAGLAHAQAAGIPTQVIDHRAFGGSIAFDAELDALLRSRRIDLVACAGFMRIMTAPLIERWQGRMLNIHPSLLPAYKGLDTHARALAGGATSHGCTVHFVTPDLDSGPIIAQASVPVLAADTPETLAARVLEAEHRLYPEALKQVASSLPTSGSLTSAS